MLVITRKNGQKIMIGDNIEITIVESRNNSCKIAIQADKDIKIYREEIYLQSKLANMVGTNTKVSSVDSVNSLIKGGKASLNGKIEIGASEEEILDNKNSKSIRVNNRNDRFN